MTHLPPHPQTQGTASETLTDDQIIGFLANAADALDATRVHEMQGGKWHATTIFAGDAGALRFARMVEQAARRSLEARLREVEIDAERYRWLRNRHNLTQWFELVNSVGFYGEGFRHREDVSAQVDAAVDARRLLEGTPK